VLFRSLWMRLREEMRLERTRALVGKV
jgi:hypothetical protein